MCITRTKIHAVSTDGERSFSSDPGDRRTEDGAFWASVPPRTGRPERRNPAGGFGPNDQR
jgi:hypothetical protein